MNNNFLFFRKQPGLCWVVGSVQQPLEAVQAHHCRMPSSQKLDSAINLFLKEIILARSGTGDFTFSTKGQISFMPECRQGHTIRGSIESFFFLVCLESKSLLPVEISRPGNNKQKEKLVFACARLRHQAPKSRFFSFFLLRCLVRPQSKEKEDYGRTFPLEALPRHSLKEEKHSPSFLLTILTVWSRLLCP